MNSEPVGIGALVVAFVNAVIQLGVLVHVYTLDVDQLAGVNIVLVSGVVLVTAVVTRSKVSPVAKTEPAPK